MFFDSNSKLNQSFLFSVAVTVWTPPLSPWYPFFPLPLLSWIGIDPINHVNSNDTNNVIVVTLVCHSVHGMTEGMMSHPVWSHVPSGTLCPEGGLCPAEGQKGLCPAGLSLPRLVSVHLLSGGQAGGMHSTGMVSCL